MCWTPRQRPRPMRNRASRAGEEIPLCWLICEWPEDEKQRLNWLSNLPEGTPIEDLVRLSIRACRLEQARTPDPRSGQFGRRARVLRRIVPIGTISGKIANLCYICPD